MLRVLVYLLKNKVIPNKAIPIFPAIYDTQKLRLKTFPDLKAKTCYSHNQLSQANKVINRKLHMWKTS